MWVCENVSGFKMLQNDRYCCWIDYRWFFRYLKSGFIWKLSYFYFRFIKTAAVETLWFGWFWIFGFDNSRWEIRSRKLLLHWYDRYPKEQPIIIKAQNDISAPPFFRADSRPKKNKKIFVKKNLKDSKLYHLFLLVIWAFFSRIIPWEDHFLAWAECYQPSVLCNSYFTLQL